MKTLTALTPTTAGQQRKLQRTLHLVAAALLLGCVYAPAPSPVQDLVRFVVFPLLVVTGVAMWQAPRVRRFLRTARSRQHPYRGHAPAAAVSVPSANSRKAGPPWPRS